MLTVIFLIILMILSLIIIIEQGIFLIHKLQLVGYKNLKFIKWLESNQYRTILLWSVFEFLIPLFIILIFYFYIESTNLKLYKTITSSTIILTFLWKIIHPFIMGWIGPKSKNKKPLIYTHRVKRLFITLIFLGIISFIFVFWSCAMPFENFTLSTWGFFKLNAFLLFIALVSPIYIIISNILNIPVEKAIYFYYSGKAKNKLKKYNIKNICITGSYGKTSTKFFLATILSEKYKTLYTPASYNTPMGISKVINESDLNNIELFVCEMGADHFGEINQLCKIVPPDFGIVTAIDLQHLETFGSIENIIITKISLFTNLKENSFGVFNYDSQLLRDNIKKFNIKAKLFGYSITEKDFTNVDIIAKDIKHTRKGLKFNAILKSGEDFEIETDLLGSHNASNLLAAILSAKILGLDKNEIINGIKKIKPVEHRLQKIDSGNGILVLDDAFNSNLNGAIEALRILSEIEGNKKIIVTPGLVELGEKENELNKILGEEIAKYSTIAILVGKERTKYIQQGILSKNFPEENLYIVNSLNEAKDILKQIVNYGDVILFENDLPDTYNE